MAAISDFSFDTSELREAFQLYRKATEKGAAVILNNAAKTACVGGSGGKGNPKVKGALQLTKLASLASINKWDPEKEGKGPITKKRARLHYAILASGGMKRGQGIKAAAIKSHNRRRSSRAYSKAIWLALAADFGANLRGRGAKAKGTKGVMAVPGVRPVAKLDSGSLENSHITDVMAEAFRGGLSNAATEMRRFAIEKLQKIADDHSAL